MSELFIHVGLPRTGTTFLQKQFFPNINNVNFMIKKDLARVAINCSKTIISSEGLSGFPYINFDDFDSWRADRCTIMERIKLLYPDAKIILVLREEESLKRSLYNYLITKGRGVSYDYYINHMVPDGYFDFDEYIKCLNDSFSDVYIARFEDLKNDVDGFIGGLCDFLGVDFVDVDNKVVNKSLSGIHLYLRYLYNLIGEKI